MTVTAFQIKPEMMKLYHGVEVLELPWSHSVPPWQEEPKYGVSLLSSQTSRYAAFVLWLETRSSNFTSHFPSPVNRYCKADTIKQLGFLPSQLFPVTDGEIILLLLCTSD